MKTKICTKCSIEKSLDSFCIKKASKDNHNPSCKSCMNLYKKKFNKKYPWKSIFKGIKFRCTNKKSKDYKNYGLRGIKCLITEEELKKLWFRDKAYLLNKPSIDRKENDENYIFSNCRFIEIIDNIKRQDKKSQSRSILQFDLNGTFIREFPSIREASRHINIQHTGINQCCLGTYNRKTAGGYKWKYKI